MPSTRAADLKNCKRIKDVQLRLELGDNSDIRALTRQLETFTKEPMCNLVISDAHSEHVRDWHAPEVVHMFEVIGNIPNVVHLAFESLGTGRSDDDNAEPLSVFPISLMTNLLRKMAPRLETLCMESCVLTGANLAEMEVFEETMASLKGLRVCLITSNFDLNMVLPPDCDEDPSFPLDGVVSVISKLPLVVDAAVVSYAWYESGFPFQFKSSEPMKDLLKSPSIQIITLGEFHLANEGLKDVARGLEKNTTLRRLELHFSPSPPRTSMASLNLLANALKVNTSLEVLKLEFEESCPKLDSFLVKCAEALCANKKTALKKFKIASPLTYGSNVEDAFCNTLQSNYSLEKLEFLTVLDADEEEENYTSLEGVKRTEVDLLLRLNQRGRKTLVRNNGVAKAKWVRTLHQFTHDLDALHHYIRMNPWLCHAFEENPTPMETEMEISPAAAAATADTPAMLQSLQELITLGFSSTRGEIQQLHAKVDVMSQKHAREKEELEAEVKRLRQEVATLKQNGGSA